MANRAFGSEKDNEALADFFLQLKKAGTLKYAKDRADALARVKSRMAHALGYRTIFDKALPLTEEMKRLSLKHPIR